MGGKIFGGIDGGWLEDSGGIVDCRCVGEIGYCLVCFFWCWL